MAEAEVRFGFPQFWPTVYNAYRPASDAAVRNLQLATEMFNAAHGKMSEPLEFVVYMLVSSTATGLKELLILAGNGAGAGAMKISRGMFESAVMAEYLRIKADEVDNFTGYGRVLDWKRLHQYPESVTSERAREIEDNYNRVKPRFVNKRGKVRNHWNKKSISQMACAVGRGEQYELSCSIAASIHHGNFEAMLAHVEGDQKKLSIVEPPSMEWVKQALMSGHVYLLQALETQNACLRLGFEKRIKAANEEFQDVWRNRIA